MRKLIKTELVTIKHFLAVELQMCENHKVVNRFVEIPIQFLHDRIPKQGDFAVAAEGLEAFKVDSSFVAVAAEGLEAFKVDSSFVAVEQSAPPTNDGLKKRRVKNDF
jgi:hypothetical protein